MRDQKRNNITSRMMIKARQAIQENPHVQEL